MMTDSLAKDFDIEYTRRDLIRYYQSFDAGPKGIFLKKGKEGRCFYAKSAAKKEDIVIITGSLFTVGETRDIV